MGKGVGGICRSLMIQVFISRSFWDNNSFYSFRNIYSNSLGDTKAPLTRADPLIVILEVGDRGGNFR